MNSHREPVTRYFWDNSEKSKIQQVLAPPELAFPDIKLDIDTQEDLQKLNEFVEKYAITATASAAKIVRGFNEFTNS
ncbi:MAG: hypothetical protein ACKOKA_06315 [Acidimicrobiaceae bacterium]